MIFNLDRQIKFTNRHLEITDSLERPFEANKPDTPYATNQPKVAFEVAKFCISQHPNVIGARHVNGQEVLGSS